MRHRNTARTTCGLALGASILWASTALVADSSQELRVLTYNTHGMSSWIAGDDPQRRLPIISELLNGYDVVLLQEDFAYPELLASHAKHPVIERGNPPAELWKRWLPIFAGSGLTTFSQLPLPDDNAVTGEALQACSGWLSGANDCWASKGFLRLRLRLDGGEKIDVYNLHLDAGQSEEDRAARRAQLERLRIRIAELSFDGALIIGGDFNLRASNADDASLLENFRSELRLLDSGARRLDDGPFEAQIDYLLYRDGGQTKLELVEAGPATEFETEGVPLSDHPALFAHFRVTAAKGRPARARTRVPQVGGGDSK
jgi:endonuclease/exonuclease/phosphatase family metal-dependent hydrolase